MNLVTIIALTFVIVLLNLLIDYKHYKEYKKEMQKLKQDNERLKKEIEYCYEFIDIQTVIALKEKLKNEEN